MTEAPEEHERTLSFPDGSTIQLRPIGVSDGRHVAAFVSQLSSESEYRRFLSTGRSVRNRWVARLLKSDQYDSIVEGALVTNRFGTSLVAVAESIRSPDRPERAEFAMAVIDTWQRLGIGSLLVRHLAARAITTGTQFWDAVMLAENRRMAALLDQAGQRVFSRIESGLLETVHDLTVDVTGGCRQG